RPYYSIPVRSGDTVLAVLILYLEPGHKQDIREIFFLRTVANVLTFIVKLYRSEQQVHQLVHYDQLTKLPNKRLLRQHLTHEITDSKASDKKIAVLFLDIDGLKRINESMGHELGDDIIKIISKRLQQCIDKNGMLGRWDGDEFVVVLSDIKFADEVFTTIRNIFQRFLEPISLLQQKQLIISTSIGVSVFPADGSNTMTLVQNADMAMHTAKSRGGNCHQFYTEDMNDAVIERLGIETGMRSALEQNQFELYYQPLVDIGAQKITGAEALIRWNHPTKGQIPPDRFIPVAEDSELIIPIGKWVINQACIQCKQWHQQGLKDLKISVNLSAKQFRDNTLPEIVNNALEATGLNPSYLTLELTESSIMENVEQTIESLHKLKNIGVSLSIDDFGTGYSSLAYLKRFPIDKLKIDRSFVQNVDNNADDKSIVQSIIALGHNLKLSIIAEGVEKVEHMNLLDSLNCEESQGYYISRPLPKDQFIEFVLLWQKGIDTDPDINFDIYEQ
ncbi:MAG TPA: bifunctional diguanylate cyclase/phosphodiesterase, partial [Gammaproteobacteria bacterium]|nr:bifunctional diguanylate cyclase/phosphodiesterase [Gammaproteobacteria bacterium]